MLLPDPRRRGEIHFWAWRALPYRWRLALIAALLAAGFAVLRAAGHGDAGAWAVAGNAPAERFYAARGAVPGPRRVERRGPHALEETGWIWAAIPPARDLPGVPR